MANRQETILQGTAPLLLAQLGVIAGNDQVVEAKRSQTAWIGWVLMIAGFAMLFVLPALGILLWAAALVDLVLWRGYRATDLDNERIALARDLVVALEPDLSTKTPARLVIRHGGAVRFGTKSNERTEGSALGGRVHLSEHEDDWFLFQARLRDKSSVRVEITETAKSKRKPKRKYTKTAERFRQKIAVTARLPAEVYPHLDRLKGAVRQDPLRTHALVSLARLDVQPPVARASAVTGEYLRLGGRSGVAEYHLEHKISADKVVSLLTFLYAGLSHCRADAAPSAPPA